MPTWVCKRCGEPEVTRSSQPALLQPLPGLLGVLPQNSYYVDLMRFGGICGTCRSFEPMYNNERDSFLVGAARNQLRIANMHHFSTFRTQVRKYIELHQRYGLAIESFSQDVLRDIPNFDFYMAQQNINERIWLVQTLGIENGRLHLQDIVREEITDISRRNDAANPLPNM